MIVVLVGYMASGKSTLGKILAEKLNFEFQDLDDYIEKMENTTISAIFKLKGEVAFRMMETQYLKELLASKNNLVLSLGGGTPCYGNNMEVILKATNAKSIYLKASIPTLVSRLKTEKNKRPLLARIEADAFLTDFIGKHLFERSHFYSLAEVTVTTANKVVKDIVEELILQLF